MKHFQKKIFELTRILEIIISISIIIAIGISMITLGNGIKLFIPEFDENK